MNTDEPHDGQLARQSLAATGEGSPPDEVDTRSSVPATTDAGTRRSAGRVADTATESQSIATKRTLAALSFAIERVALGVESTAIVIALFQRAAYFAPIAATYQVLADHGASVVVMYAGEGDTPSGITTVHLSDEDPRANEWSVIVLGATVGAYVIGADLDELDLSGRTMEDRRLFRAQWGFDRSGAALHARRVLTESLDSIPPHVAARLDQAILAADALPTTTAETALGQAALCLAASLDKTSMRLDEAKARLDRETQHATRDPLTGLANREGLQRWLGGSALDGVNMPLIGVVMIDLDGFKAVNDTHGHDVGDRLLQAVAKALVTCTRPGDIVTRWGGDEFVVLCPGSEGEQLTQVALGMVAVVAATSIGEIRVGASAGIQSCRYRPLPMGAADEAMYAAKRAGGGRVVAIGPPAT